MIADIKSLKKLEKIYSFKKLVAEREFEDQRKVVEKSALEVLDITESVFRLESAQKSNSAYMRQEAVCCDAEKMVAALKYKEQIQYDVDRESYFLRLAQADLEAQKLELRRRRSVIQKLDVKSDAVKKNAKKIHLSNAVLEELSQEEEFEQTNYLRSVQHV